MQVDMNPIVKKVRLEASTFCQLKCCQFRDKIKNSVVKLGYLKFKNFKKFIDTNPVIKKIELSNYGEIFLNPELKDIIKYAYEKKVILQARNGVNLNNVKKKVLEYLVKYQFREMVVSIDGATNEIYKIYRRGGNLNKVLDNIKIINDFKKEYNSEYPILTWQFILFGHNEHELPAVKKMAAELNMIFKLKLNALKTYSPIKDKEFVKKESGLEAVSREEYKEKFNKTYLTPCKQLWLIPQINWDGKLLGCCINKWGDYGNVFEEGLDKCLNNEKYLETKKILLGLIPKNSKEIYCSNCDYFNNVNIDSLIRIINNKKEI